jgi:hypothetical protein
MEVKAKVTTDNHFLQITECSDLELDQIKHSFKKRISNWRFHPLVKKKVWDGYITFIDKYNRIPGYFRKDVNFEFNTPQGKGRFVVLKRKDV